MRPFPLHLLQPLPGRIEGPPGDVSITVPLEPFRLPGRDESFQTSVRLDAIDLPDSEPAELAGKVFTFPVNPEDGYIDGSIYVASAHHPCDVTMLRFGRCRDGGVDVEIEAAIDFDFEGLDDYGKTPWSFRTFLAPPDKSRC